MNYNLFGYNISGQTVGVDLGQWYTKDLMVMNPLF